MPAYCSLINWTDQGIKNAKETVNRARAAEQAAQSLGGRKIGVWWAIGQYDMVLIFEAPDDETATRFLITLGMDGNVRSTTLRLFSEDEMTRLVQGLP